MFRIIAFVGLGALTLHVLVVWSNLHSICTMRLLALRSLILFTLCYSFVVGQYQENASAVTDFFQVDNAQGHTNNWAVLVCSSRYWFNYRVREFTWVYTIV